MPRTGSTNITAGAVFGHSNVGHILSQPLTRPASAGKQVCVSPGLAELRHDICQKYRAYWEKLLEDPDKKVTGLQSDIAVFQRSVVFGCSLDISDTPNGKPMAWVSDALLTIRLLLLQVHVHYTQDFAKFNEELSPLPEDQQYYNNPSKDTAGRSSVQ